MERYLKQYPDGYYANLEHIKLHQGGDPMYKSQFTYKKFFDNDYVDRVVRRAFEELNPAKGEKKAAICIAYKQESGKRFYIGKKAGLGHVIGDSYHIVRAAFALVAGCETEEVWINTSLYPVPRAEKISLWYIVKIK